MLRATQTSTTAPLVPGETFTRLLHSDPLVEDGTPPARRTLVLIWHNLLKWHQRGVQGAQGRGTAPQCRQQILSNTQRRGAQHSHEVPLQFTFSNSVPSPVYKPAEDQVQPLWDQRTGTHLLFTPTPDLLPSLIHL